MLEKGYLGGGNTARNTTIIRSNYLTPEGVKFYDASLALWAGLSEEFDLNLFYSQRGHFTLAHSDADLRTARWRAEVNKHFGVRSEVVDAAFVKKLVPQIDLDCGGHSPILGALYHEPGAIARHDAVAWGYARGADRQGVEIHQNTEVLGIDVRDGAVAGVRTSRGNIATKRVLCAVAGSTPRILKLIGLDSPLVIHPLQAMVSEPLKPWLDPIIVSSSLHAYVSQSARGELVMGASLDPQELHSTRSTLDFAEGLAAQHARPVPVPLGSEGEPAVGRHGRHDAGFLAHHGPHALRRIFPRRGLGHLGFQGHADLGQDDGAHRGDRHASSADHRLLARALRAARAHGRKGRGVGGPLRVNQ